MEMEWRGIDPQLAGITDFLVLGKVEGFVRILLNTED